MGTPAIIAAEVFLSKKSSRETRQSPLASFPGFSETDSGAGT
jgi:hypothetical protein